MRRCSLTTASISNAAIRAKVEARFEELQHHKRVMQAWLCCGLVVLLALAGLYYLRTRTSGVIRGHIQRLSQEDEAAVSKTVSILVDYGKRAVPQLIAATGSTTVLTGEPVFPVSLEPTSVSASSPPDPRTLLRRGGPFRG